MNYGSERGHAVIDHVHYLEVFDLKFRCLLVCSAVIFA